MKKIKWDKFMKIIIILCILVAIIGLFLPYEKSIGDYRNYLLENPDIVNVEEVNYKNKDVVDISIIENYKVYKYSVNNIDNNNWIYGESLINIIITIILIISLVLILLFTLFNKNILVIIFDIILAISSLLMNYDIVDRGVIPSDNYTYGISYFIYIIIAFIIFIDALILIIKNKKSKTNKKL